MSNNSYITRQLLRKRIVHLIESLGIGGAQSLLFELYISIDRCYPEYKQSIVLLNGKKLSEPFVSSSGMKWDVISKRAELIKYLGAFKERVTIIFHKLMCSDMRYLQPFCDKYKILAINHTYSEAQYHNKVCHCHGLVSVSEHMNTMMTNRFMIRGRKYVIRNAVDHARFDDIAPLARNEDGDYLITGRVNSLNSIKYSDKWISFCANIKLPKPMIHEYVGAGPGFDRAKNILSEIDSSNDVRMLGIIKDFRKKIARIKSWDLFLYHINRHEGISMSVLEALACGVPVICSNHSGNKEIIEDGVNGYVFRDFEHAEEILTELCRNRQRLDDLSQTTRDHFLDNLDASIMSKKYVETIDEIEKADIPRSLMINYQCGKKLKKPGKDVIITGSKRTHKRIVATAKAKRKIRKR